MIDQQTISSSVQGRRSGVAPADVQEAPAARGSLQRLDGYAAQQEAVRPTGTTASGEGATAGAPPVVVPAAGVFGMVTDAVELVAADGSKVALNKGDAVEVTGGDETALTVKAWSGHGGQVGSIPTDKFKQQPRLSNKDGKAEPEGYSYQEYTGDLFLARTDAEGNESRDPSIKDVDQGSVGDCFLIAALGAVAASRPDIIKDMVSYDATTKLYKVTFKELQGDGTYKDRDEYVDGYLPSGSAGRTAYAQSDSAFDPNNQALWPAIVEKAYAQWKGGYDVLDEGGRSSEAMEAITGVESVSGAMPSADEVVSHFEALQKDKKSVVCGTRDWVQQSSKAGLFSGSGDGPFTATLTDVDGAAAELEKNQVSVADKEGKAGTARDDGAGAMTGTNVDAGAVTYDSGAVSLTYKSGKGPAGAADLSATYRYEGMLSSSLNLHGNHAYIFREVKDGMLYFHNPWGPAAHKHPKGISAADFRSYFETIAVNTPLPKSDS